MFRLLIAEIYSLGTSTMTQRQNLVIWSKGIAWHFQGICWNPTRKHRLKTHKTCVMAQRQNLIVWSKAIAWHFQGICWKTTHKHCLITLVSRFAIRYVIL